MNGERDYTLIALAALLVVGVVLVELDLGLWAVVPLLGGLLGVLVPGSVGPPFVLLSLVVLVALRGWLSGRFGWRRDDTSPIAVALFAMATLAYVAAHARLLSIKRHAVPPDARREQRPPGERARRRWFLPMGATKRSGLLPSGEVVMLLLSTPAFALVSYLLWMRLMLEESTALLDLPIQLWRVIVVTWAASVALMVVYALSSYLRRTMASRDESLMVLQDQLWAATRGEQRRANSWAAWARLKKEGER